MSPLLASGGLKDDCNRLSGFAVMAHCFKIVPIRTSNESCVVVCLVVRAQATASLVVYTFHQEMAFTFKHLQKQHQKIRD
jgi:hypothetical protein